MIYITGDTHGSFGKFNLEFFPEQEELTKNDYVIICGDFGIWDNSERERINFDDLEAKNYTTLFVDGNHENFDLLNNYPVEKWRGGDVHFIRPSVIHLMRGNVFVIDGKKFFTMGGASSHDIQDGILDPKDPNFKKNKKKLDREGKYYYRIKGVTWWEDELPKEDEIDKAKKTLESCNWKVDYIISHCAPFSLMERCFGYSDDNRLTRFFDEVSEKCEFTHWFFGHYHENYMLGDKFFLLYEKIFEMPEELVIPNEE